VTWLDHRPHKPFGVTPQPSSATSERPDISCRVGKRGGLGEAVDNSWVYATKCSATTCPPAKNMTWLDIRQNFFSGSSAAVAQLLRKVVGSSPLEAFRTMRMWHWGTWSGGRVGGAGVEFGDLRGLSQL